ncbi:MAG: mandelate racemase/muconate lactonizing enzyme family protein [Pseudomonadota bacterium]
MSNYTIRIDHIKTLVIGTSVLVWVTLDDGTTGIGEGNFIDSPQAVVTIIDDLRSELCSLKPRSIEEVSGHFLFRRFFRDSVTMAALSAIDQALWDARARQLSVPLWYLLGGSARRSLPILAWVSGDTQDDILSRAESLLSDGYRALKLYPFVKDSWSGSAASRLNNAVEICMAVRDLAGSAVDIGVEVHRDLEPAFLAPFCQRIASISPLFVEDPTMPFLIASQRSILERINLPIAIGERHFTSWEFRELSDLPSVFTLRPDIGLCGGVSQFRKICAIAESRQQAVIAHNCTGPVALAMHAQMGSSVPNTPYVEMIVEDFAKRFPEFGTRLKITNGEITVSDEPGCGPMLLPQDFGEDASLQPAFKQPAYRDAKGDLIARA